ncbi:MAG: Gfo/Idh/MocA family protein [Candidatus Acetothermia bacterium]
MGEKQVKNVGMIGYSFMGKAHSHAYKDVPFFFSDLSTVPKKKIICGRTKKLVAQAADKFGWEEYRTDWRDVVADPDIDIIDIVVPPFLHSEIAVAAAEEGKDVICEKPPALNYAQAREMADSAKKSGVRNMIGFNYRRVPAVALAKKLIDDGYIGEIRHFRGVYLQDWCMDPDFPLTWHFQKDKAGSGPTGGLHSHLVDLARFLVGDISEVSGLTKNFVTKRPIQKSGEELETKLTASSEGGEGEVGVEDAALFLAKFNNGAVGTFEATHFAAGRKNHEGFEVNGSKGSLKFNFEKMNRLKVYSAQDPEETQGFKDVLVTEDSHPYIKAWWPPGHLIGYENTFVNEIAEFFSSYDEGEKPKPDFNDGRKCQRVLDAVLKSADTSRWIEVDSIK